MQRRDVLRSGAGLAAASAVGLAGCSGSDGEETDGADGGPSVSNDCGTPEGDLKDALPEGEQFEQVGEVRTNSGLQLPESDVSTQGSAAALYTGPNDTAVTATIVELGNKSDAETLLSKFESEPISSSSRKYTGYVFSGQYLFWVFGDESARVRATLEAMGPLGGCVDSAATVVEVEQAERTPPQLATPIEKDN